MTNMSISRTTRTLTTGLAVAALAFSLAGCSAPAADQTKDKNPAATSEQAAKSPVTIADAWVKATSADAKPGEAMSGVFGTLKNSGDKDLTITGVSSDAAGMVELHEVVDGKMRKIEGDVTVPAGGSYELAPGANHIMLMDIPKPLLPGDDVKITVKFSDGSTLDFTALVKDTLGANESYSDMADGDHSEHGDHGEHDEHGGH